LQRYAGTRVRKATRQKSGTTKRGEKKAKGIDPCKLVRLRERENDGRTGPGLKPVV
jgi:hypothetical protein